MMASNLPPGVSESMIPGNRPADLVYDKWLEGRIGEVLAELATDSLSDLTDCPECKGIVERAPDLEPCARCEGALLIPWPPFDVQAAVLAALEGVRARL